MVEILTSAVICLFVVGSVITHYRIIGLHNRIVFLYAKIEWLQEDLADAKRASAYDYIGEK